MWGKSASVSKTRTNPRDPGNTGNTGSPELGWLQEPPKFTMLSGDQARKLESVEDTKLNPDRLAQRRGHVPRVGMPKDEKQWQLSQLLREYFKKEV